MGGVWGSVVRHFPDSRIRRAVAAAGLLAAAAHGADEPRLTWTSGSGEPAWSASVSGPAGEEPREPLGPLLAPAWFEPAPDVTVDLVGGGRFRLSEQRGKVVVLDFWASWCEPCKVLMPLLEKIANEYRGAFLLAKVNADEQQMIAQQFGVRSLPTVMVIQNGRPVDGFVGAKPEAQLRQLLEKYLSRWSFQTPTTAPLPLKRWQLARMAPINGT